jgi:hypothetical protein
MGTAHDAKEVGLCSHGLACQAGAWGRYIGFCLGYGHDDYGGVAGPNDEPTMPNGAHGSGRRPCASRRDECTSRPPESMFRHRDPTILGSLVGGPKAILKSRA